MEIRKDVKYIEARNSKDIIDYSIWNSYCEWNDSDYECRNSNY
jgi:hypothetical protein